MKNLESIMLSTSEINAAADENKTDFSPMTQSPEFMKYINHLNVKLPGKASSATQLEKKAQMNMDSRGRSKNIISAANISLFKIFIMRFLFLFVLAIYKI